MIRCVVPHNESFNVNVASYSDCEKTIICEEICKSHHYILFCQCMNEHIIANETLEPGCRYLLKLAIWTWIWGFVSKKEHFVDGHECEDESTFWGAKNTVVMKP